MTTAVVKLGAEVFEDTSLLTFPLFAQVEGLAHAVTTRPWNMATHRGPRRDLALERRRKLCTRLGLRFEALTAPEQVHGGHVLWVRPDDLGAGGGGVQSAVRFADGLVCGLPGVPLMVFSADCPMIVAAAPSARVCGVAHASWRGTTARIAHELVRQLCQDPLIAPRDLFVGISPCAGPTAYEVGEDVFRIAGASLPDADRFFRTAGDRRFFDLRAANVAQLEDAGVRPERICVAAECTIEDTRFFSHRRDGPNTGRFALVAGFP